MRLKMSSAAILLGTDRRVTPLQLLDKYPKIALGFHPAKNFPSHFVVTNYGVARPCYCAKTTFVNIEGRLPVHAPINQLFHVGL